MRSCCSRPRASAPWSAPGCCATVHDGRTVLTVLGSVLAVVGLVQVTFRGVGGSWFVAFLVAVVLLHLPAARAYFARDGR